MPPQIVLAAKPPLALLALVCQLRIFAVKLAVYHEIASTTERLVAFVTFELIFR